MTAPNIYQLLGNDKDGVVTICEDEADGIDEDRAKMKIYKDGATTNVHVFRTDISFGRKQLRYKTFCFKAFAAEELPDAKKAKGFRQRCITFKCTYGSPRYDIPEVIEPGGDKKLQGLLNDLFKLRNMLLIHRLLHYHDEMPNVELNIKDREKQLFKPTFRVFQKSRKALNELKLGINKYLSSMAVFDPIFWLHHCNVDRIWAQWQDKNPEGYPPAGTIIDSQWNMILGQNMDDLIYPWNEASIRFNLDYRNNLSKSVDNQNIHATVNGEYTFVRQWSTFDTHQFSDPAGVLLYSTGDISTSMDNVYVAVQFDHRIDKFTSEGVHFTLMGFSG
jgi:hypothetical protein